MSEITKEKKLIEWLNDRLGLVYLGLTQLSESPGYWETYYEDEIEPLESIRALIESSGDKASNKDGGGGDQLSGRLAIAPEATSTGSDDKSTSPDRNGGQDKENAMEKIKSEEFAKELSSLLNKHSVDNACGTPDFILADFGVECLEAAEKMMKRREEWFGRDKPNA